jgi:hypothetical protein
MFRPLKKYPSRDNVSLKRTPGYPGKPAAADLQLGLATAPVLFATAKFPQLNAMIERRFR